MRSRHLNVGLLVFCLVAGVLAGASAQAGEAVVMEVKGKVGFGPGKDGPWKPLEKDMKLGEQTFVRTAETSSVVLRVDNDAVVTVHELSEVYLKNLGKAEVTEKNLLMLLFGKLWAKVKKQENGEANFSVHTPAAIAAVRGTEYYVESDQKTKNSVIGVWDGAVGVYAQRDRERKEGVVVNAGFMIEVVYNEPPSKEKLLKLAQARIQEQQQFNEQMGSLGLTNVLGGAAVETAKLDEARTAEARDTIRAANDATRGTKRAEEDFTKISRALGKLRKDTGFLPGEGKRKTSDKSKTLTCLLKDDDGSGKPIEKWAGPYIEGNLLDAWGTPYGVYQVSRGGAVRGIMLHSCGPNKGRGDNDDVEKYVSLSNLDKLGDE